MLVEFLVCPDSDH